MGYSLVVEIDVYLISINYIIRFRDVCDEGSIWLFREGFIGFGKILEGFWGSFWKEELFDLRFER